MSQIIELNMDTTDYYVRLHTPLIQWSHGHIFRITGLQQATNVEIHCSLNDIQGEAVNVPCSVMDGIIDVKIPRMIMEGPAHCIGHAYKAYMFLFHCESDYGETVRKIEFSIRTRPKPADYEYTEEEVLRYWNLEDRVKSLESRTGTFGESLYKLLIKPTTQESKLVRIHDSADFPILDFGVSGRTTDDGIYNDATGRYEIKCSMTNENIWNPNSEHVDDMYYRSWKIKYNMSYITVQLIDRDTSVDVSDLSFGLSANGRNATDGVEWLVQNGRILTRTMTRNRYHYVTLCTAQDKDDALERLLARFAVMIAFGSQPTEYVPNESQTFALTSPVPLTKWDKLIKRDGVWGWTYGTGERAFCPLPDEEQSLLNNLKTYYGVTNVYNNQGCPMWVKYVADTQLYVDNKIASATAREVWLSDLDWVSESSGDDGNPTRKDSSCGGNTITLWDGTQEVTYEKGIGSHAPSAIEYDIEGHGYKKFIFDYGIDRESFSENDYASIVFKVYLDDTLVFTSQEMKQDTVKGHQEIDVTGVAALKLVMDQGEYNWTDHGDWAGAKLMK